MSTRPKKKPEKVRPDEELFASLQNPDESSGNDTYARRTMGAWYVIVGRGAAAWYNHLTLNHPDNAWGKARLGGLNVMHLGFREPWCKRKSERMGQWPRMLDLFKHLGEGLGLAAEAFTNPEDWLPSRHFAKVLQNAEEFLKKQYAEARDGRKLVIRDGHVGIIEPTWNGGWHTLASSSKVGYPERLANYFSSLPAPERKRREIVMKNIGPKGADYKGALWTNQKAEYRLSVYNWSEEGELRLSFVYAHKIDICTSFGVARLFAKDVFRKTDSEELDEALYEEHLPALEREPSNSEPQRIIDGNVYIGADNNPDHTVLVYKGNPVGAQSVQSALDMPRCGSPVQRVWWISNKELFSAPLDANVPGARNLLEIIGATPYDGLKKAAQDELKVNFGKETQHYRLYRLFTDEERKAHFAGKLLRGENHALTRISAGPERKLTMTFTIKRDPAVYEQSRIDPAQAAASVVQLQAELDSDFPPPGLTTGVDESRTYLEKIVADQLVFSLGQQNDTRSEGSAAYLIQMLGAARILRDPTTSAFPLGITDTNTDDDVGGCGCVRVLGAAAARSPGLAGSEASKLTRGHADHGNTLPQECPAGGGGLNVNLPCVWRANRYQHHPIPINTASLEELQRGGLSTDGAKFIIALRAETVRGITVEEFQDQMGAWQYGIPATDISALDAGFTF